MTANKITNIDIMTDFLTGCDRVYSGNFVLKGCMALRQYIPKGKEFRNTQDIDFSVKDSKSWEVYVDKCCEYATKYSKLKAKYTLVRRRGYSKNPNSDSLKFTADLGYEKFEFKVDMNIKPDDMTVYDKKIGNAKIFSIYGMLGDKINVALTRKLCRRVKDLIDIYYITLYTNVDFSKLVSSAKFNKITENYLDSSGSFNELEHAYNSYKNIGKPDFNVALNRVKRFIEPVAEYAKGNKPSVKRWSKDRGKWQ